MIDRVARVDAPVLITGETGTGKELVAEMLHAASARADGPLIAINCGALPDGLFQAEVFGHEKGAFTGADSRRAGRIEAAEGGTLFLDEMGDLSPDHQAVLLRFLENGAYEHIGSDRSVHANVRIIAATHVDLELACRRETFREDLYYRLNAFHLRVPPLRERREDIITLALETMAEFSRLHGLPRLALSSDAIEALTTHAWPGNVRELRNRLLQGLVLSEEASLSAASLGFGERRDESVGNVAADTCETLRIMRREAERRAIEKALKIANGNVQAAASYLDVSRAQLYRLIKDLGLEH